MDAIATAAAQYIAIHGKQPTPAQLRRFVNTGR